MPVTFSELGKKGRLGNILFQIAATVSLALDNGDDYIFPDNWDDKKYFNIPLDKFVKKVHYSNRYIEPTYHYTKIPYSENLDIEGYWQSELNFANNSNEIKKLLTPNVKVEDQNYMAMHVRRTDYLIHKNCYHILTRENYYDKAMYLSGANKFLIFSDDINWCKQNFKGNEFSFAENNNHITDLALMTKCTGNIIANSSFSWWGAYLNPNNSVIYPRVWFGPELSKINDTKDLCPQNWMRV